MPIMAFLMSLATLYMTVYNRISTPSDSASSWALRSGRMLKPIAMALEAEARSTSVSVTAPAPPWRMRTFTFSVLSLFSMSENFNRALDVRLENDRQFLDRALSHLLVERFQRQTGSRAQSFLTQLCLAVLGDLSRLARILKDLERVPRVRQVLQALDLHGHRRPRRFNYPAPVVQQSAHAAMHGAGDERIANTEVS